MRRRISERGEGNLGCIIWALIVIVVFYIGWNVVPVKMASAQLGDFMEEQAKFAEHRSPQRIKKAILIKARKLNIPLDEKHIHVERKGDRIYMKADYVIPVRFVGGYTYEWQFQHDIDRPIYIF
jgi:hypothetical protein